MNYKQFTLKITAVNLVGWLLLELYWYRYVNSPIELGVIFQIIVNLAGYYFAAISSSTGKDEPLKYHPYNCPGHDWHPSPGEIIHRSDTCIICQAKRGVK